MDLQKIFVACSLFAQRAQTHGLWTNREKKNGSRTEGIRRRKDRPGLRKRVSTGVLASSFLLGLVWSPSVFLIPLVLRPSLCLQIHVTIACMLSVATNVLGEEVGSCKTYFSR
jgi:hypothetical protein